MSMPTDAFSAAIRAVEAANEEEVPLKLLGGQAVRYLTPDYPPRQRRGSASRATGASTSCTGTGRCTSSRRPTAPPPT